MAANTIKGLTIAINGETTGLDKALSGVNSKSKSLQSELKEVERLLKLDPDNTELLAQKQKLLADSVGNTADKLKTLKTAAEQAQTQLERGEISEEQFRALQREVVKAEQGLSKLETQALQSNAALSKEDAVNNLKNIGTAVAGAAIAAGAAFAGMAVAAMNNADELQRQADVTGLSAERLQELQYAGNNLGVELDTITGAQAKLTKSMFSAMDGTGSQAEAFKALGVNILDSNGNMRDAKAVMEEAFTALNGVGNETERDALAMQIFGKSAMEMNPLIKAGGDELARLSEEARNSGAVMSNEAVAGLDTFGDTVDNLKNAVLGSFGEKFAELLPHLQAFVEKLQMLPQWLEQNSTLLQVLGVVVGTITALIIAFNIQQALMASGTTLWAAVAGIGTTATTALATAMAFLTSPIALVIVAIGALVAAGVLIYKNWDTIKEAASKAWGAITETLSGAVSKIQVFFTQTIPAAFQSFIDFIKNNWQGLLLLIVNPIAGAIKLLYDLNPKFREWVDSVLRTIKDKFTGMVAIGRNLVEGLWNGVWSKVEWLKSKITGFVDSIKGWFTGKGGFDTHSPSKWAEGIGAFVTEGLANGILKMKSMAVDAAQTVVGATQKVFDGISYDSGIDYAAEIAAAQAAGEFDKLAELERTRNAKIDGDKLSWAKTFDFQGLVDTVSTLAQNASYAVTPVQAANTYDSADMAKMIAEAVNNALVSGLAEVGDSIFDAIPKRADFNVNGRKMAQATWDDFTTEGSRRGLIFAPSRAQIASIAMSVMPKTL